MIRINLVLLLAVVLSAVYLVSVQYESRSLFMELNRANTEAHQLASEQERLQVERRAQATPGRVERISREKLQMRQVTPAITNYVTYSNADAPSASTGANAAGKATSQAAKTANTATASKAATPTQGMAARQEGVQ